MSQHQEVISQNNELDLNNDTELDLNNDTELDLFAEELPNKQQHFMPPNTLSTLACECETISTFFCYGCGI